jgi:hypothetical protein
MENLLKRKRIIKQESGKEKKRYLYRSCFLIPFFLLPQIPSTSKTHGRKWRKWKTKRRNIKWRPIKYLFLFPIGLFIFVSYFLVFFVHLRSFTRVFPFMVLGTWVFSGPFPVLDCRGQGRTALKNDTKRSREKTRKVPRSLRLTMNGPLRAWT